MTGPIRSADPAKKGKRPRDGRLILLMTRGLFGDLPFTVDDVPDPRVALILGGVPLLTELLILRANSQRQRLGCYRGDFAVLAVILAFSNPFTHILRASMKRK